MNNEEFARRLHNLVHPVRIQLGSRGVILEFQNYDYGRAVKVLESHNIQLVPIPTTNKYPENLLTSVLALYPRDEFRFRPSLSGMMGHGNPSPVAEQIGESLANVIRTNFDEPQKNAVCTFLASRLEIINTEIRQYRKLESDANVMTQGHTFLDVLHQAKQTEKQELQTLYDSLCGDWRERIR